MKFIIDYDVKSDDNNVLFKGLLANVNSDILKLKLDRGFRVRGLARKDGIALLAALERVPKDCIGYGTFPFLGWGDQIYVVENKFDGMATTCGEDYEGVVLDPEYNDANRVPLYLEPTLQRLRFLTCKNIRMPLEYYYIMKDERMQLLRKVSTPSVFKITTGFSLSETEMSELEKFTKDDIIPFKVPFLDLAFQHFESSFETENKQQAFISLMIALEIILQPNTRGYLMARNASNLLGSSTNERRRIKEEITELHDRRNKLVHQGFFSLVDEKILSITRVYVKRVILKAFELGKDKDQLYYYFNSFPWS